MSELKVRPLTAAQCAAAASVVQVFLSTARDAVGAGLAVNEAHGLGILAAIGPAADLVDSLLVEPPATPARELPAVELIERCGLVLRAAATANREMVQQELKPALARWKDELAKLGPEVAKALEAA